MVNLSFIWSACFLIWSTVDFLFGQPVTFYIWSTGWTFYLTIKCIACLMRLSVQSTSDSSTMIFMMFDQVRVETQREKEMKIGRFGKQIWKVDAILCKTKTELEKALICIV